MAVARSSKIKCMEKPTIVASANDIATFTLVANVQMFIICDRTMKF